jgi:REP element-mobilizing transposase RayT
MPQNLRRYHESGQSHFVTFSCYHRRPKFATADAYDLFPVCLEEMRRRFRMRVYGYIVMPEHVHLLLSEPEESTLADAIHFLKLSFSKRVKLWTQVSVQQKDANLGHQRRNEHDDQSADRQHHEPFWQKRYYDRNVEPFGNSRSSYVTCTATLGTCIVRRAGANFSGLLFSMI